MKSLVGLLVVAMVALGIYMYSVKSMPVTDSGTAPTQAISLTGVRNDLLQIAQAERSNIALNGNCQSLDALVSSGQMAVARRERDGYTYAINCAGSEFTVTAQHPAAPEGSPIRYPNLMIDSNMQISEMAGK